MTRNSYEIPVRLSVTQSEMTISPETESGTSIPFLGNLTIKTMIFSVMAGFAYYILWEFTGLHHGGPIGVPITTMGYVWLAMLLVHQTKTGLNGWDLLAPMIKYVLGIHRSVSTRPTSSAKNWLALLGIRGITKDNGKISSKDKSHTDDEFNLNKTVNNSVIVFSNYDIGEILEVDGNASILKFPKDQQRILDSVGNFYQHLKPDVNLTYDSANSAQRVTDQLRAKKLQLMNTPFRNTNLETDLQYQYFLLKSFVGKKFHAWHQYIVVRAPFAKTLSAFNFWMNVKVNSGLYIKGWRKLNAHEMFLYFKHIYGDDISINSHQ